MQQNSFMFPESLPFFCTNKLFQFSPTVYFEERRFRASQIQQIWLILFYWKLLKRVYSITNLASKAFIEWFDSCTCQNSRHQHNQRKISNRFLQRILWLIIIVTELYTKLLGFEFGNRRIARGWKLFISIFLWQNQMLKAAVNSILIWRPC